jgi:hypothetical protein
MKKIFLVLFLCSCGVVDPPITTVEVSNVPYVGMGIDPAFFNEVMAFEREWGRHVTNTDIFFVERLSDNHLGETRNADLDSYQKIVMIDRQRWEQNPSVNYREPLIFHELGHAVLGLDHYDAVTEDGKCPRSVMHSNMMSRDCWEKNRRSYIDLLFKRR